MTRSEPADAPDRARRAAPPGRSRRRLAWLGLVLLALAAWPFDRLSPALLLVVVAAWPATLAERRRWLRPLLAGYRQLLMVVALVVAVVSAVDYFSAARPWIGSVDFFYYLCNARDMLLPDRPVADGSYHYFPGVYAFWRTAMRSGGFELDWLQQAYLAVLLANAFLAGALVLRLSRHAGLATAAAIWYLALATRFEGLAGVTEPIATLPLLAALLVWGGRPLQGARGLLLAACLGLGWGLALYTKQQAGLLALGASALLLHRLVAPPERRHQWLALASIPIVAAATALAGILLEGRGLMPLHKGLALATTYAAEGSLAWNLYVQLRADEAAAVALLASLAAYAALLAVPRWRTWLGEPWFEVTGVLLLAHLATLLQFTTRAYGHYGLFGTACLPPAALLLAWHVLPRWLDGPRPTELTRMLLLAVVAIPLVHHDGSGRDFYAGWRRPAPEFQANELWHARPAVADDLRQLAGYVDPGERMMVVPPRYAAPHWLLGTYAGPPDGYGFQLERLDERRLAEEVAWEPFDAVLLLDWQALSDIDRSWWDAAHQADVAAALERAGFRPVRPLGHMTLYRPD